MISALSMEWQKLLPIHRTSRTVAVAVGLAVVVSAVVSAAMAAHGTHMTMSDRLGFDSLGVSLQGVNAAVLAVGVFGVLTVTREYGTGMIRTTFLAHPSRLRVLAAKLATHAAVAGVAAAVACLAAYSVGPGRARHRRARRQLERSAASVGTRRRRRLPAVDLRMGRGARCTAALDRVGDHVARVFAGGRPGDRADPAAEHDRPRRALVAVADGAAGDHRASEFLRLRGMDRASVCSRAYVTLTLVAGAWRMARSDP